MTAPSRFVREAIARREAAGECPFCGTKLIKNPLYRKNRNQEFVCPRCIRGRIILGAK